MNATIAILKDDRTWEEEVLSVSNEAVDGMPIGDAREMAEECYLKKVNYTKENKFPDGVVGIMCISMDWETDYLP